MESRVYDHNELWVRTHRKVNEEHFTEKGFLTSADLGDLETRIDAAQEKADTAYEWADAAITDAGTASTVANSAAQKVADLETSISGWETRIQEAETKADEAKTTADGVNAKADSAIQSAVDAAVEAGEAKNTAGNAKIVAETTALIADANSNKLADPQPWVDPCVSQMIEAWMPKVRHNGTGLVFGANSGGNIVQMSVANYPYTIMTTPYKTTNTNQHNNGIFYQKVDVTAYVTIKRLGLFGTGTGNSKTKPFGEDSPIACYYGQCEIQGLTRNTQHKKWDHLTIQPAVAQTYGGAANGSRVLSVVVDMQNSDTTRLRFHVLALDGWSEASGSEQWCDLLIRGTFCDRFTIPAYTDPGRWHPWGDGEKLFPALQRPPVVPTP